MVVDVIATDVEHFLSPFVPHLFFALAEANMHDSKHHELCVRVCVCV